MIADSIKIRRFALDLNSQKIKPPKAEVKVENPKSFYEFVYNNQPAIDGLQAHISSDKPLAHV